MYIMKLGFYFASPDGSVRRIVCKFPQTVPALFMPSKACQFKYKIYGCRSCTSNFPKIVGILVMYKEVVGLCSLYWVRHYFRAKKGVPIPEVQNVC